MHRGKFVIMLMALVGCVLGWVSVSFSPWLSRQAIPLWGSAGVASIRNAPHVAALELRPAGAAAGPTAVGEILDIGGDRYRVSRRQDVTDAPGLDHIRHELLVDGNFLPDRPPPGKLVWQNGLEFTGGGQTLIVVFDWQAGEIGRADGGEPTAINRAATGWLEFFADQLPAAAAKRPPPSSQPHTAKPPR